VGGALLIEIKRVLEAYEQHAKQYGLGSREVIRVGYERLCKIQEEQNK
jgi:hypothetical protein